MTPALQQLAMYCDDIFQNRENWRIITVLDAVLFLAAKWSMIHNVYNVGAQLKRLSVLYQ